MTLFTRKTLTASIAALAMTGAIATTAAPAQAGWGWTPGGAVAAGVVGGFALGALAASRPVYASPYYAAPVYYAPTCYRVKEAVPTPYGWRKVYRTVCN